MTRDLVVTGEAVALDAMPSTVGTRVLSGLIDYVFFGVMLLLTLITMVSLFDRIILSPAQMMTSIALIMLLWIVVIPMSIEVFTAGRSLGKIVMGTRVVRHDGGPIRLRHSFVRIMVAFVEVWLTSGMVAVLVSVISRRGQRLGDYLAGTYVVNERMWAQQPLPVLMPPELEAWVRHANIVPIDGSLTLAARGFLARARTMDPMSRHRQGIDLAQELVSKVSPPPPPQAHPERVIAAILAERRDREYVLNENPSFAY
ncbi:RDD family protein [Actinomyces vulturis]|uniref:RDD family protein n=1 Tax=Actinomyces vulturis TaxID=1857645 RepID=UPI001FE029AE|nr:RDD family protein [Actinomyces vulturis]